MGFLSNVQPDKDKGFMFEDSQEMINLDNHPSVEKDGHSGALSALAKRVMQTIARNGFEEFKRNA